MDFLRPLLYLDNKPDFLPGSVLVHFTGSGSGPVVDLLTVPAVFRFRLCAAGPDYVSGSTAGRADPDQVTGML